MSVEIRFLNESNAIEGIDEINYSDKRFQNENKGHYGAFIISQNAARSHLLLNHRMIRDWQGLIGREQKDFTGSHIADEEIGHFRGPQLLKNVRIANHIPPDYSTVALHIMNYIEDVNEDLRKNNELYATNKEAFITFVSKWFLKFERIHPFADGNGRVGRLIANYLSTYCHRPIIVFLSDLSSRNRYLDAHRSFEAMQQYIASCMNDS